MAKSEVAQNGRVDVDALLADDVEFDTAEVEIPGLGTVLVRALSRAEQRRVYALYEKHPGDVGPAESYMASKALVEPAMTVEQVDKWATRPAGKHLGLVIDKCSELSGLEEGAAKEATQRFPE